MGLTPLECVWRKLKQEELEEAEIQVNSINKDTLHYLKKCENILESFDDFINEEKWPYALSFDDFLWKSDDDLKVFMGFKSTLANINIDKKKVK